MYKILFKRFFDLLFAIILIPFFVIVTSILFPIIYLEDKGTIFYNSNRLGQNGKVFKMYKFRSMKLNSPDIRNEDGSTFNSENDTRLTRVGKIIRKTSIDEVPQILNVIKGEMSFVGPRPDLPEHLNQYEDNEVIKLSVKPGITGYNQAYFRNKISWKRRIQNDIYYVGNISLLFDIKILFKTLVSIMRRDSVFINSETEENHEK